jgi:hypothetical protein
MTRGTVPHPDQVITALRANNDVLRSELFGALAANRRAFWRGVVLGGILTGAAFIVAIIGY